MRKKIKYTDAPKYIAKAIARSVQVKDFLPSPEELMRTEAGLKRKIKYTKAPKDAERALGRRKIIDDSFLPSSEEFRKGEERLNLTIHIPMKKFDFFKAQAHRLGYSYPLMINKIIEYYVKHPKVIK
jgi:hypothetical protein